MSLREDFLRKSGYDHNQAAAALAQMLSEDDEPSFKVGYTPENATLAALDIFPEADADFIRAINGWS